MAVNSALVRRAGLVCGELSKGELAAITGELPQIATVRPKSYPPAEPDNSRQGEIVNIDAKIDETTAKIKIIDRIKEEEANIFKVAPFGVVGNYAQAVPALIAKIQELYESLAKNPPKSPSCHNHRKTGKLQPDALANQNVRMWLDIEKPA